MSINRGTDKEDMVHTYNGILVIKKNEILSFAATWMDREMIVLSEVSQTEKDISYDITYRWTLKIGTNELICKRESDSQA